MSKIYTIDASVFTNAFNPYEAGHETSRNLLAHFQRQAFPLIEPTLLFPEVAAAIARGQDNTALTRNFAATLARLPHLLAIPLDAMLAQQAAEIAAAHRLRGSDAVYAAVALRFGSTLITLDNQQRERSAVVISTATPAEEWEKLSLHNAP